jgi:glycerol uptake facilitator-like aquaporin
MGFVSPFRMHMHTKAYVAEFLGTFALTLTVLLSIIGDSPSYTPLMAGLVVGMFVYTVGSISGAHFNPAVTLSMLSVKKISAQNAVIYIVIQIVASLLAAEAVKGLGGTLPALNTMDSWLTACAEALGAFILIFGIAAVVYGKVHSAAAGVVIGGSLVLGIRLTLGLSNGVLNPAVAIGIGSASAIYLVAPIVGGILAIWCYKYLIKP